MSVLVLDTVRHDGEEHRLGTVLTLNLPASRPGCGTGGEVSAALGLGFLICKRGIFLVTPPLGRCEDSVKTVYTPSLTAGSTR